MNDPPMNTISAVGTIILNSRLRMANQWLFRRTSGYAKRSSRSCFQFVALGKMVLGLNTSIFALNHGNSDFLSTLLGSSKSSLIFRWLYSRLCLFPMMRMKFDGDLLSREDSLLLLSYKFIKVGLLLFLWSTKLPLKSKMLFVALLGKQN